MLGMASEERNEARNTLVARRDNGRSTRPQRRLRDGAFVSVARVREQTQRSVLHRVGYYRLGVRVDSTAYICLN